MGAAEQPAARDICRRKRQGGRREILSASLALPLLGLRRRPLFVGFSLDLVVVVVAAVVLMTKKRGMLRRRRLFSVGD